MSDESNPDMQAWKAKIAKGFEALDGKVILVGHSIGGDDWEKASILNASLLVAT